MMEMWKGLSYESILRIPVTLRHRLLMKKVDLEKKREDAQKAEASRARSASRRR